MNQMNQTVLIRPATIADAEAIYLLNRDSLGYDYDRELTRCKLAAILDRPGDRIFVAQTCGQTAGYIQVADYECTYADSLKNVLALAVAPAWQGRGIGRALLAEAEKWAQLSGCQGVRLNSGSERTAAHQFYRHCGYQMRKDSKCFRKLFD